MAGSGGRFDASEGSAVKVCRAACTVVTREVSELKDVIKGKDNEIEQLKEAIKDLVLQDEVPQPSRSDVVASQMVESEVKCKNGHYVVPVPLKPGSLPNNYVSALNRATALRSKALKQPDVCQYLVEAMSDLKSLGYIEPVPCLKVKEAWSSLVFTIFYHHSKLRKELCMMGRPNFMKNVLMTL